MVLPKVKLGMKLYSGLGVASLMVIIVAIGIIELRGVHETTDNIVMNSNTAEYLHCKFKDKEDIR